MDFIIISKDSVSSNICAKMHSIMPCVCKLPKNNLVTVGSRARWGARATCGSLIESSVLCDYAVSTSYAVSSDSASRSLVCLIYEYWFTVKSLKRILNTACIRPAKCSSRVHILGFPCG